MQCFLSTFLFSLRIFEDSKIRKGCPENCPPRKIAPRLELGFGLGLGLELELGTIFLWGNCPRTCGNVVL